MLSKKHKAATSGKAAAQKNIVYQNQIYSQREQKSRAKLEIGTILLVLQGPLSQKQRKEYWQMFESGLRQYVGRKICGGGL